MSADRAGRPSRAGAYPAALVALMLIATFPAPLRAHTLAEVYRLARERDAQFSAARRTFDAVAEKVPQARAGLLPSVALTGNPQRQSGSASFAGAPAEQRDVRAWSWNVQITQPVLRLAQWAALAQADAQLRQAQAQFDLAEQELILRVAQAYLDVLLAHDGQRVAQAQLQAVTAQFRLTEHNRNVGTGTVADLYEAEARLALSRSQSVAATNELSNRQVDLEKLLGETLPLPKRRLERNLPPLTEGIAEDWSALAANQNPQVKILQAGLDAARQETTKNRSGHLPTLDLVVSHGSNFSSGSVSSPSNISTRVNSSQIGVQFNLPLFAGGGTQARVRESMLLEDKARDDLVWAERTARTQAKQAFAGVINGQAQVEALQTAVTASRHAVEANKVGFRIGTRINPDVLNAEQQLHQAMRDLMKARVDTVMHSLRLKAAAGILEATDLAVIDRLMENRQ